MSTRASTRSQFSWKRDGDPPERLVQPELVEVAQLHEVDAALERAARRMRMLEQPLEQVLPALLEGQVALELVEHAEPGRQPGRDRELVEQPPGEGVQRADRGVVEIVERGLEASVLRVARSVSGRRRPAGARPAAGGAGRRRPSR